MLSRWFGKKPAPLAGAPAVRRQKTYSAQSGYVYQYFYEGHRPFRIGGEEGQEFIFNVSADRKNWDTCAVLLTQSALSAWEGTHGRKLSQTEWYAIAKIALFQAFDERPAPALMKEPVRVRSADVEAIVETLDL